jgi:eukaryotic-like serine/threonine-protein kinase
VDIGPFQLGEPIGQGSMATVWAGVHRALGTPVAVKVLAGDVRSSPRFAAWFRTEVQAVATLDHPGVIRVFDCGEVAESEEGASLGRLRAGSPWLAMELAGGGTLESITRPPPWEQLVGWLRILLEALAHAHAHGVVHRDIKPANILLSRPRDPRPGIKLADFGIAHLQREQLNASPSSGTPAYMAPEQFGGSGRDLGPWTDLYALGCVVFRLVTGRPPFLGDGLFALARAHAIDPPPRIRQGPIVAGGFEQWLRRLVAKQPAARYRTAPDAAHALEEVARRAPAGAPQGVSIPVDWRGRAHTRRPRRSRAAEMAELGTGLGLFGLRPPALVGREPEQDRLWELLTGVDLEGRGQAVVLRGPTGIGTTRLADWLGRTAAEAAGASYLRAEHDGDAAALQRMAARHLNCVGLDPSETLERCRHLLEQDGVEDGWEAEALAGLVAPAEEEGGGARLSGPAERHGLLRRLIERAAADRPVIVLLDDVITSADGLALARHLIGTWEHRPCRVVLLMTATDEACAEHPEEATELQTMVREGLCSELRLSPLPGRDMRVLVQGLLRLEGSLAAEVEARSDGHPWFAVELVSDWVQRGVLVPGPTGLALPPGARAALPDGIHALWKARLEALLVGLPGGASVALEVLSTLGPETELDVWREVCAQSGSPLSPELLPELVERNLARPDGRLWSLSHRTLSESLRTSAERAGRQGRQHDLAAEVLSVRLERGGTGRWERIGDHLLQAGRFDPAWDWLTQAAQRWGDSGEYARGLACLDLAVRALQDAAIDERDPRAPITLGLRAQLLRLSGDLDGAARLAGRVERLTTERLGDGLDEETATRWRGAQAGALCLLGIIERDRASYDEAEEHLARATGIYGVLADSFGLARVIGARAWMARDRAEFGEAERLFEEALALYESCGDAAGVSTCIEGLADTARRTGEPERAVDLFERAIDLATSLGHTRNVASMRQSLAQVLVARGQLEEAHELQLLSHAAWERLGAPQALATSHNALGEVQRALGLLPEAEENYRRSLTLFEVSGSPLRFLPMANLTQLLMGEGLFEDAAALLDQCEELVRQHRRRSYVVFLSVLRLPCTAAAGRWDQWDVQLPATRDLLTDLGAVDRDVAQALELAGRLAAEADQPDRAAEAWTISEKQWAALGNEEAAARLCRLRAEVT